MLQYQIIHNYQHGFWQGYSVESQLITVTEDIFIHALDHKLQIDVILLDFQKAFLYSSTPVISIQNLTPFKIKHSYLYIPR